MFLKAFRIKSNTAIRGSDRRKLRSDVGNTFPSLSSGELNEIVPNKEEMSIMRIVTHSGQNVTVYCLKGEPLFFEIEKQIFPTVYTAWKKPDLVLHFTTWPPVFEKLQGGADLMLPGVINILPQEGATKGFGRFERDAVCIVNLKGNRAAVAVGVTAVSSRDLVEDGMRGKGVLILHTYLDNLWAQGSKTYLPQIEDVTMEEKIPGKLSEEVEDLVDEGSVSSENLNTIDVQDNGTEIQVKRVEDAVGAVHVGLAELQLAATDTTKNSNEKFQDEATAKYDKESRPTGPSVEADGFTVECSTGVRVDESCCASIASEAAVVADEGKSPQEQMDDLLEYCFLCALLRIKKNDILPLLTSAFYKNYILPSCPDGASVDIKKSSHKKLSKFLLSMQERNFINLKELSKGVDSVSEVNWAHQELKAFKASQPVLTQCATADKSADATTRTSQEGPKIEELFSVSGATVAIFSELGYRKGDIFTAAEIRTVVTNYVKNHELTCQDNKKLVLLDPTLTKVLISKNECVERLPWDALFSRFLSVEIYTSFIISNCGLENVDRVLSKMSYCHRITLPGQQAVVRKGKIEAIEIKIEQRMGNKKVTLVNNLELYGIDPQEFAHALQIKAASSTSVSQLPGKHKAPGMQVLIQGKHVPLVAAALLDEYKIAKKYVTGLEQMKGGKKKK